MKQLSLLFIFSFAYFAYAQSPLLPAWANSLNLLEKAIDDSPENFGTEDTVIDGDIVINEIIAINQNSAADQDGEYDDWIELYNNTDSTVSLLGLFLSDNPQDSVKWPFPDTSIAAHDYLIVWADNDSFQTGLHAHFKLSGNGESVWLGYENGPTVDSVDFGIQNPDISFSRIPNGTGPFQSTPFTYSEENTSFVVNDTLVPGSLVINEFMAKNNNRVPDQNGQYDDWIELYNNTDSTLSLSGLFLSDESSIPAKWAFPDTTIQSMNFLIIWADDDLNQDGLHANFKLSNNGEFLSLAYADGTILDSITFGVQGNDTTYGRFPNGTGPYGYLRPTFSKSNSFFTGIEDLEIFPGLKIYPNPTTGILFIEFGKVLQTEVKIFSITGQQLIHEEVNYLSQTSLNINKLSKGIYFIQIGESKLHKIILH